MTGTVRLSSPMFQVEQTLSKVYSLRVLLRHQQIVQNQITNQTIHPIEDFTQTVVDAYESGKSALISLGIIFAVLCVGASIGFLFDQGFSSYCNSNTVNNSGYPECEGWTDTFDEENFTQVTIFLDLLWFQ